MICACLKSSPDPSSEVGFEQPEGGVAMQCYFILPPFTIQLQFIEYFDKMFTTYPAGAVVDREKKGFLKYDSIQISEDA